jgi:hypothetical protein
MFIDIFLLILPLLLPYTMNYQPSEGPSQLANVSLTCEFIALCLGMAEIGRPWRVNSRLRDRDTLRIISLCSEFTLDCQPTLFSLPFANGLGLGGLARSNDK